MKLLIQTAMIFFGTLMAAGLIALGEPASDLGAMKAGPATALTFFSWTAPQR